MSVVGGGVSSIDGEADVDNEPVGGGAVHYVGYGGGTVPIFGTNKKTGYGGAVYVSRRWKYG